MATQTPTPTSTTATLLVEWANQQDAWVRTLTKTILETGIPLADNQVGPLYDQFLQEKHLKEGDAPEVPALTVPANEAGTGTPVQLNTIKDVQNVNALAPGQTIAFNPKLTIIFGENAAGKSGYVRVIKRASNARTREPILPNLYTGQAGTPTATIDYTLDGQASSVTWQNEEGLSPLNRIDVFDVRAAAVHVDEDLTYTYTPGELNRFPHIQQGITSVQQRLDQAIGTRAATKNPFVQHFDRRTKLYTTIENLGATTDLNALEQQAIIAPEEQERIATLQTEVEALKSNTPQAQLRLATTHNEHLATIQHAVTTTNKIDAARLQQAQEQLAEARSRYDQASKEGFAGLAIPGILQPAWKKFIEAGEAYLKSTNQETYPTPDDHCAYCQQPLTPAATDLLKKYRDYCNNAFRADLDKAHAIVETTTGPVLALNTHDLTTAITASSDNTNQMLQEQLPLLVAELAAVQEAFRAHNTADPTRLLGITELVAPELASAITATTELISTLKQRADERTNALKTREEELANLQSRSTLQQFLPQVKSYVADAQWVDKARIQARRFPNILRTLTETAKAASEEALNKNFAQRFHDECKNLRAPNVELDFPGRQGQVTRRKTLTSAHRLNTVLSEGEQKVIALADFLAEIGLKPPAPVVFDDPITSLDYRRLRDLVKRIADLSQERQVVVFSHNIWFTTELLSKFEKNPADCSYYDLARTDQGFGIITKGTHPRADTFKSVRGRLNSIIQTAQTLTGEPQAALIESGYEHLRNICEIIVEKDLLAGVTERYEPNVRMTKLPQIRPDRLQAAIAVIQPIYDDCCRYIASHSQPLETLCVRPTLDDLRTAWANVQAALAAYKE